jgi:hypothetical protein
MNRRAVTVVAAAGVAGLIVYAAARAQPAPALAVRTYALSAQDRTGIAAVAARFVTTALRGGTTANWAAVATPSLARSLAATRAAVTAVSVRVLDVAVRDARPPVALVVATCLVPPDPAPLRVAWTLTVTRGGGTWRVVAVAT